MCGSIHFFCTSHINHIPATFLSTDSPAHSMAWSILYSDILNDSVNEWLHAKTNKTSKADFMNNLAKHITDTQKKDNPEEPLPADLPKAWINLSYFILVILILQTSRKSKYGFKTEKVDEDPETRRGVKS